jgi:hypothetical protein
MTDDRNPPAPLVTAKKELAESIGKMYKVNDLEAKVLQEMFVKMNRQEMRLLCKIVRVANREILYS